MGITVVGVLPEVLVLLVVRQSQPAILVAWMFAVLALSKLTNKKKDVSIHHNWCLPKKEQRHVTIE